MPFDYMVAAHFLWNFYNEMGICGLFFIAVFSEFGRLGVGDRTKRDEKGQNGQNG